MAEGNQQSGRGSGRDVAYAGPNRGALTHLGKMFTCDEYTLDVLLVKV